MSLIQIAVRLYSLFFLIILKDLDAAGWSLSSHSADILTRTFLENTWLTLSGNSQLSNVCACIWRKSTIVTVLCLN